MTLRPARLLRLRRLSCRVLGHRWSAVRRRWHSDRYDSTFWTPRGRAVYVSPALIACMACGKIKEGLYVDPGAEVYHRDYQTWFPPKLRPERINGTCPLCLLRGREPVSMRCECCGVTDEELDRAGIR